jgi:hypothetical protein
MWGIMNSQYSELSKGYAANISRMNSASRGFTKNRLMGYAESHDEERLMYRNLTAGNSTNALHNVKNLNVALSRMSAIGAVTLLVPGPKMIWHFGDLGMENSIFMCTDGTVNTSSDVTSGDCKLATKPQPQWTGNWLANSDRSKIYSDWSKMITMKIAEPVFSGTATINNTSSLYPNIKITNSALASGALKDVLIIANFNVTTQTVPTGFAYTGTWYNLMDNTTINVTNTTTGISIPAGEFRIYGNKQASLAIADYEKTTTIQLYPNPASSSFSLNINTTKVQLFSITGQLVKSFEGNQSASHQFAVNDLNKGLYVVKVFNENNEVEVLKLIKN